MGGYILTRLSRLWVVLIPALLATFLLDSLGAFLTGNVGYDGRWHGLLSSGPGLGADSLDLSLVSLLGNVLFLQTIFVPVFGTNGPLWSLANEFWYYLMFPFVAIALHQRSVRAGLGAVIVVGGVATLSPIIASGFLFWLMGWLATIIGRPSRRLVFGNLVAVTMVFGASIGGAKLLNGFASDFVVAVGVMMLLVALPAVQFRSRLMVKAAVGLSNMSYSLYLFHFPFVSFCWFVWFAPRQLLPGISGYTEFLVCLLVTLLYCLLMWWLFERHTGRVRHALRSARASWRSR